jgi:hypothetical protein
MKKFFLVYISVFSFSFAQSQTYFDYPFGGGGGFMPGVHFVNLSELNKKLSLIGLPEFSNKTIFTTGGGGYIYIGFIPQLRVGGLGYGGSKSISHYSNDINYQVDYSLGVGGFTVEYTLPFVKNIAISIGAIIGGGEIIIEYYENFKSFSWPEVFTSNHKNNYTKLTNDFYLISPTINIDIPIYRFISIHFGIGYQLTFSSQWHANNKQNLLNAPKNLDGNSFFIQSGIYIGFFAF